MGRGASIGKVNTGLLNHTITFKVVGTWLTTITTCPLSPATPTVALVTPFPRARTLTESTRATTDESGTLMVVLPGTEEPSESRATAVTVPVSPNATNRIVSGDATNFTGRWATRTATNAVSPADAAVTTVVPFPIARTLPLASTVAIAWAPVV